MNDPEQMKERKRPFLTEEKAREIARKYPTPFHVYDERKIRNHIENINRAFSWNKGYRQYFAVKANPNPYLLRIMKEYDWGCDCSSMTELILAKELGFDGSHIMFSSNCTPAEEYAFANKIGGIINLDDFTDVAGLEKTVGRLPETICCRYNPGGVFQLSNGIMDTPGEAKYGMTKDQILTAFALMKGKGVKRFGLHAFLASNTVTNEYYPKLAEILFRLAVEIKTAIGIDISFVDLSGGVGLAYKPQDIPNDILTIGESVRQVYEKILIPAGLENVAIYTEMGRFAMGDCGALITKVVHEKHTYKEYVGCDACASNLMRPMLYRAYHHITVLGKENEDCNCKYDVTGSLCENSDKFAVDRMLPKIEIGDLLYIHDTGAHGHSMGYQYNGKLRSAEILLKEDGSYQLIRRAETVKDYFATLDFSDILSNITGKKGEQNE